MEVVTEFRDEEASGTLFDRSGLTDLFIALKADGVRLVLAPGRAVLRRRLRVALKADGVRTVLLEKADRLA
jgi:hypothetical protein